ncbi:MAG TPA: hypothetical protein VME92_22885 [Acetobacteraceae bacterium]|nr:hypothetical protein [Acetobacteraceae bacterium]
MSGALQHFRDSLAGAAPPTDADLALQALWWAGRGDWDRAHACAQEGEDSAAALVHAHLHRIEGDAGNAAYWYRRAGRAPATLPLDAEWAEIAEHLLARPT